MNLVIIQLHQVTTTLYSYGHLLVITYNWLFLWDYTFYKWGDLLVLLTGITRAMPLTPPKHRLFKVRGGGLGIGDELGIASIWHPGGSWKPWGPQDSW